MKIYEDPQIEKIEKLLRRVCFYIKKKGRTILEDYDITPAQFEALQIIVNHKEVTISELSNKLYQAPSTITDLVDRMESKDLVKRVRDSKDRRIVRIEGLEKGHNILEAVIMERCKFLDYSLENVSKEDKDSFTEYLDILEHAYTEGK
ncbi:MULTISPECIES: MarR family winged helix-turn-helix transcriptional regulator [Clostridium]|uniref:MarR family transcriptional regulator n=1 Tax=Clostridium sulfidigenes TaxID=318464 RepID=A0A084J748_9CLOT|nr:MarR family transcriptional regulator [Clostridium sulfidigenes]KEZ84782.1 MarR family transcriptional regulator [Clostridium sulfidigenes]HAR84601.1 MarR family transcriptional regulator [Clostridium sp.]HBA03852.1 MarR family transcriptional regulator [Clostridium sp.]